MEEKEEKRCWQGVRAETGTRWCWDLGSGARGGMGEKVHDFPGLPASQGNIRDSCPAAAASEGGEESEGQHQPG